MFFFFNSNYKKEGGKIYSNNHKKERERTGVTEKYYDWQTNNHDTARVPTYGGKKKKDRKIKKKNKRIRPKTKQKTQKNQRDWHLGSLIQLATEGTRK